MPLGIAERGLHVSGERFRRNAGIARSARHESRFRPLWGFDPDDALYLMGPLAWLGWLTPILVAASVGATTAMVIVGMRLRRTPIPQN